MEYLPDGCSGKGHARNRTFSVFSSQPESPTDSTDERQMLLDIERNIANLEKTYTDGRRSTDGDRGHRDDENGSGGCKAGESRTHKKGLFRYSSFTSDKDTGANDRKRWVAEIESAALKKKTEIDRFSSRRSIVFKNKCVWKIFLFRVFGFYDFTIKHFFFKFYNTIGETSTRRCREFHSFSIRL